MLLYSFRAKVSAFSIGVLLLTGCGAEKGRVTSAQTESPSDHQNYGEYFRAASEQYNIPKGLLEALAYVETRWHPANQTGHKDGDSDHRQVFGIMGLHQDESLGHSLSAAAKLIGKSDDELIGSTVLNIEGGAALVSRFAKEKKVRSSSLSAWSEVVRAYSGIPELGTSPV